MTGNIQLYQQSKTENNISFLEKIIYTNDSFQSKDIIFLSDTLIKPVITEKSQTHQSLFKSHNLQIKNFETGQLRKTNENWIAFILLFCIILFTYIRFNYRKRLGQIFKAFFSERDVNQLVREGNLFYEGISVPLFINYTLIISLFVYFASKNFHRTIQYSSGLIIYGKIILIMGLIYLLKILIVQVIGFIFKSIKETTQHILIIYIFNQVLGLILLPFLIIIYYATYFASFNSYVFYSALIMVLLVYLFRIFRLAFFGLFQSKFSNFYLFLYLCTVEILPLLILTKFMINRS